MAITKFILKYLRPIFGNVKSWLNWFTFLRAFFALPPKAGDLERLQRFTGRSEWPTQEAKEAWLAIGTRGGKSFIISVLAVYLALCRKYNLKPGETGHVILVAPTRRQAQILVRYISAMLAALSKVFTIAGKALVIKETTDEIQLSNGIAITVLASDYRSLRGFTAIAGIVDEIAFMSIEGTKPDYEIVRALRTRLMTTGGPLICISSPYAKRGALWDAYKKHFGRNDSRVLFWQAASHDMNPTLSAEELDHAREEDPEGSRADIDAQFRDGISQFLDQQRVEDAMVSGRLELPFDDRWHYAAFVDPSGGGSDAFTLAIGHHDGQKVVLDLLRRRVPPFSPKTVVADFCEILKNYQITKVVGDFYSGEWVRSEFKEHGVSYELAGKNKSSLYLEFESILNTSSVELLDNEVLLRELSNLERKTGRGGNDSVDHPPRSHDDLANVCAGVCYLLYQEPPEVQIRPIPRPGKMPLEWVITGPHASYQLEKSHELDSGFRFVRLDGSPPYFTGRVLSIREFKTVYEKEHGRAKWCQSRGGAMYVNW